MKRKRIYWNYTKKPIIFSWHSHDLIYNFHSTYIIHPNTGIDVSILYKFRNKDAKTLGLRYKRK